MSKKILVLVAHPDMAHSRANKAMTEALAGMDDAKVINVATEKKDAAGWAEVVAWADVVVYQFPMWWGGAPAALKEWQDSVLIGLMKQPGMKGKQHLCAVTTGSPEAAYHSGGIDLFTIDELLRPYQVSAVVCGMTWLSPFVLYGTAGPKGNDNIADGARRYRETIERLRG